jgi:hypothetical protein
MDATIARRRARAQWARADDLESAALELDRAAADTWRALDPVVDAIGPDVWLGRQADRRRSDADGWLVELTAARRELEDARDEVRSHARDARAAGDELWRLAVRLDVEARA